MNTRRPIKQCHLPSLIVFGPSTSWPSKEFLEHIRGFLLEDTRLCGFTNAIRALPGFWISLVEAEPLLSNTPGVHHLQSLSSWLETGHLPSGTASQSQSADECDPIPPNTLLSTLTIIIHIVQYFQTLNLLKNSKSAAESLERPIIVQGFCTGLLAAQAVACSPSEGLLVENACRALRVAAAIGALVDLNGIWRDPPYRTSCIVARWSSASEQKRLKTIVSNTPGAFVSVVSDKSSSTITLPERVEESFLFQTRAANIQASRIQLGGSYHTEENRRIYETLKALGKTQSNFRLPTVKTAPAHTGQTTFPFSKTKAAFSDTDILDSILLKTCDWASSIASTVPELLGDDSKTVLVLGLQQCIPHTIIIDHGLHVVTASKFISDQSFTPESTPPSLSAETASDQKAYNDDAIAIIGMGCRFPGADSVEQFWDIINNGISTITQLPESRFRKKEEVPWKYEGNFLKDPESFDHRFFNLSAREAAYMDPQQRLALQVAYEALQSSGSLKEAGAEHNRTGCYIGVASTDYQDNVDSNTPGAFSLVGTVRAFIAGRISHYYGWTGPSLTFDTACSSSLVAIHNACKDIRNGECDAALAGGVNIMTSPFLFDALGAANFTSRTGPSKPFENSADGYCRGEGCGLVFLKRLSCALEAKDKILAVIPSSAVNQNENSTPITVPHSGSQIRLYEQVTARAGVAPTEVTYLEAHGTGTSKGDPIEMESIRNVFGDSSRKYPLVVGSVKGNIGHLEAASGAAALIKIILMIQKNIIPPLANFKHLNRNIPPLGEQGIEIVTEARPWNTHWKAACVNNYGAAGSNACILVCQPPLERQCDKPLRIPSRGAKHVRKLFHVSARTKESLVAYCRALEAYTMRYSSALVPEFLSDLSFNLAHRHNPSHVHSITLSTSSFTELRSKLHNTIGATDGSIYSKLTNPTPVILCFGGQIKDFVALSRNVYGNCVLLQEHLSRCQAACTTIGQGHVFPYIFDERPVADLVDLHCSLFALQYACAMSWIDSGLVVDALVGHSFGQLTALCISGVLSLHDTLSYICKRAKLIQECWGSEKGTMLSVDGEQTATNEVLAAISDEGLNIQVACYNSPTTIVLSGSLQDIAAIEDFIYGMGAYGKRIRCRKLDVTHGYHSHLVNAITPELTTMAQDLEFHSPKIPIEICSEQAFLGAMTAEELASHSHRPVAFAHAISRLANRFESACWVEAGSGSGVISLVKRNLAARNDLPRHVCIPTHLEASEDLSIISDSVATLLKSGVHVRHWAHHPSQNQQYDYLNLPPYQFEKPRHWLEYKARSVPECSKIQVNSYDRMVSLISNSDVSQAQARFDINVGAKEFIECTKGHSVLGHPLCPASLYVEMATQAARILVTQEEHPGLVPNITDLCMSAPLGLTSTGTVELHTTRSPTADSPSWAFQILSTATPSIPSSKAIIHAGGTITLFEATSPTLISENHRYHGLIDTDRCRSLLDNYQAESMQGRLIYTSFDPLVDYHPCYQGLKRISSFNGQVASLIHLDPSELARDAVTHPLAIDNFTQVAGFYVNVMQRRDKDDMFLCNAIGKLQVYKNLKGESTEDEWLVYCTSEAMGKGGVECNIYAFDAKSKALDAILLGVQFTKVRSASLRKVLGSAMGTQQRSRPYDEGGSDPIPKIHQSATTFRNFKADEPIPRSNAPIQSIHDTHQLSLSNATREIIASILQIPPAEVQLSTSLVELGIDSLVGIELLNEINKTLGVKIPAIDFSSIDTVHDLESFISTATETNQGPASTKLAGHIVNPSVVQQQAPPVPLTNGDSTEVKSPNKRESGPMQILTEVVSEFLDMPPERVSLDLHLEEAGLDSLLSIEMLTEVNKKLKVRISSSEFASITTFEDLFQAAQHYLPQQEGTQKHLPEKQLPQRHIPQQPSIQGYINGQNSQQQQLRQDGSVELLNIIQPARIFEDVRDSFSQVASQTQFAGFFSTVYPSQRRLVLSYVLEAFTHLGISLSHTPAHATVSIPSTLFEKHIRLLPQLFQILEDAEIVYASPSNTGYLRSSKDIPSPPCSTLYSEIMQAFPEYGYEHQLLHATGSKLGQCLRGEEDPLRILFGENKQLSADVYAQSPIFATPTHILATFLSKLVDGLDKKDRNMKSNRPLRILELGAGTGGTTATVLSVLARHEVSFEYTFTDLSASFLHTAKVRFAAYASNMKYQVLNIEEIPPNRLHEYFDIVIATNVIHATRDLRQSTANIYKMLRPDGILCLVELTRSLEWLDLVFGLLDGWWRFEDGRDYALVGEREWDAVLRGVGFGHVDWSGSEERESELIRVILGCKAPQKDIEGAGQSGGKGLRKEGRALMETVKYASPDGVDLYADIYYPDTGLGKGIDEMMKKAVEQKPVALLIHGGGHIMLDRTSIPPSQINILLSAGYLPISIDYRLCPEIALEYGAMSDVRTALVWTRTWLPHMPLSHPTIRADGSRIVVVGWSTGGTLAMSLAWRAPQPPDAVLAFYAPTNYADEFWARPNFPEGTKDLAASLDYEVRQGLEKKVITGYKVNSEHKNTGKGKVTGGWFAPDDPRSRIALHMNWKGQTLPVLMGAFALSTTNTKNNSPENASNQGGRVNGDEVNDGKRSDGELFPQPSPSDVARINPHAQIENGVYKTPTCLVHGSMDDLIPVNQVRGTYEELQKKGVESKLVVVEGASHLLDSGNAVRVREAVGEGYAFLNRIIRLGE